jgi:hypothetical protein
LVKVAKDMGIERIEEYELNDEDMVTPGPKVSTEQLEKWLAKDDREEDYSIEGVMDYVKTKLAKSRKKGNENNLQAARKRSYS